MSADQLAERAGISVARLEQLLGIGVLAPGPDHTFDWADVQRISIVAAYESAGIHVEDIAAALRDGNMTFAYSASIYPPPAPETGSSVSDIATEGGVPTEFLRDIYLALGLPSPSDDRAVTADEAAALDAFLTGWTDAHLAPDAAVRAARIASFVARRLTDGWVDLFLETVALRPEERLHRAADELGTDFFEPASRVAAALRPLTDWLVSRHMERALNRVNVEFLEYALEQRGLRPTGQRQPVVAFADLTDFTHFTEHAGDALAAMNATLLGDIAIQAASRWSGRLIKQLGDGVLLTFDAGSAGVDAIRQLRRLAAAHGLPPLHIGLAAGAIVQRDGDVYGSTVNLAARISGVAAAGEVLANDALARELPGVFDPIGARSLKGFDRDVTLFKLAEY